jgi:hypothetical protein
MNSTHEDTQRQMISEHQPHRSRIDRYCRYSKIIDRPFLQLVGLRRNMHIWLRAFQGVIRKSICIRCSFVQEYLEGNRIDVAAVVEFVRAHTEQEVRQTVRRPLAVSQTAMGSQSDSHKRHHITVFANHVACVRERTILATRKGTRLQRTYWSQRPIDEEWLCRPITDTVSSNSALAVQTPATTRGQGAHADRAPSDATDWSAEAQAGSQAVLKASDADGRHPIIVMTVQVQDT